MILVYVHCHEMPLGKKLKSVPNHQFNAYTEHHQPIELPIRGSFPPYVHGKLMRTGPGAYTFPRTNPTDGDFTVDHWFDGITHIHKFDIQPQPNSTTRVTYQSRRHADKSLEHARRTGDFHEFTFGQKRDPCDSFFKKLKGVWRPAVAADDPAVVNVGVAFQKPIHATARDGLRDPEHPILTATSDQSKTVDFDLETLEPYGVTDQSRLHPDLDGPLSAAHPCTDPETGDIYNYNLKFGPWPSYRLFRINASTGTTDILATIIGLDAAYLHSQFLTPNFHILCVWPARFALGGAKVLWDRNLLDAIDAFDPNARTTWVVVDRRHGAGVVATFHSHAMFCFHTVNAFEYDCGGGKVDLHCELVEHPNLDVLHKLYYSNLTSAHSKPGTLRVGENVALQRYKLRDVPVPTVTTKHWAGGPPSQNVAKRAAGTAEVESSIQASATPELPTYNPAYSLREHRYVYGIADRGLSTFVDGLFKTDTVSGERLIWSTQGHTPGEAIFVADPEGSREGDGVLLSVVLDGAQGTSYLLCLDARDMQEVGRAEVPCAVGLGFHGCFLGD